MIDRHEIVSSDTLEGCCTYCLMRLGCSQRIRIRVAKNRCAIGVPAVLVAKHARRMPSASVKRN